MKTSFTASLEAFVSPPKRAALSLIGLIISLSAFANNNTAVAGTYGREHTGDTRAYTALAMPVPGEVGGLHMVNSAPAFASAGYSYSISDAASLGTVVGTVKATDADGDAPSYTITAGNTNSGFAINDATGAIAVAKSLNYHTQEAYTLTVRATDGGGSFGEATVAVKVTAGATVPDFKTITWATVAAQQYPVYEAQGEVVNGKLYTFGGFDSQNTSTNWTPTDRAYMYDPVSNRWTSIAPMPPMNGTNHGGVTHAGFTTDGTDIYFAGGYTSNSTGTGQIRGTKEAWKYIVAENRYVRLPDLPKTAGSGQMEYLNGKLHHVAGFGNTSLSYETGDHYVLNLDNLAAGWQTLAPLPNPRNHPGSIVYGGKMYFMGGQHGNDGESVTQKDLHVYNPSTNSWIKLADMPVPSGTTGRAHISSTVIVAGNRILVIGGETSHNVRTNIVSAYSPATNTWQNLTPFPRSISGGVAATLAGNIYYTGGPGSRTTYKGVPGGSSAQQVSGFTLVNADTKKDIQTLTNGATLNLATLPTKNLNIRANTSPSTVGSVVFALSGTQSKSVTESRAPYDLMGDDGAWTPAVGSYSLKATPYTSSGGAGTAGSALTVSFSVINQATESSLISNIVSSSGRSYMLAELTVGVKAYTDRTYEVTSVPASLAGAALVRTANDDKKNTSSALLTFELSQQATVYVAYDPRATALPSWLGGWQKLTDRVGVNDSKISHMELYSKTFPAGTVSLGGNMQSPAAGAENNYFVIAKAFEGTVASGATTAPGATTSDMAISTAESNGLSLVVYPNPASGGKVFVETTNFGRQEAVTITLHDVLGHTVASVDAVTDQQGYAQAEVAGHRQLKPGIYIIRAKAASGKAQAKLLVR